MRKTIISDLEFGQAIEIALEQTFGRYVWIRLGVKVKCIFFIQKQVKKYRYNFPKFKKIVKVIELLYWSLGCVRGKRFHSILFCTKIKNLVIWLVVEIKKFRQKNKFASIIRNWIWLLFCIKRCSFSHGYAENLRLCF